jgi:hypothetical protein
MTGSGWPEVATVKGFDEKGSSALSTATDSGGTSYLYVTNSGYNGDLGDYQGHLTAINLSTGNQIVFNSLCSNQLVHFVETPGTPDCSQQQSGIWARPGVVYDSANNRIYAVTGNGDYNPAAHDWGDSVIALNPNGSTASGVPLDTYTPTNYLWMQQNDEDRGSSSPVILNVPANSSVPHLGMVAGKDSVLRLINLDNLSGNGQAGFTGGEISTLSVPQGSEILPQPASWLNPADGSSWLFVATDQGLAGIQVVVNGSGTPSLQTMWYNSIGGSSPIVANSVLYETTAGAVRAYNPVTGAQLWQGAIGGLHWESVLVANGVVYSSDESGHLTAFALSGASTPTPTPTSACPCTIWPASATPAVADQSDYGAVEVGVKVQSDVNGSVTGIRFYKGPTNTGTHVGNLWSSGGTLLGSGTFANETASGWQEMDFATPIAISANTVYVVSYHTNVGQYSITRNYFTNQGVNNPPLHALQSGVSGSDGVYAYGPTSHFPTSSYQDTNYWVDLVFTPTHP